MQALWQLVGTFLECARSENGLANQRLGALLDNTVDDVKKHLDLNTVSIIRVTNAVVKHMAARKSGLIVNVGSIAGEM